MIELENDKSFFDFSIPNSYYLDDNYSCYLLKEIE